MFRLALLPLLLLSACTIPTRPPEAKAERGYQGTIQKVFLVVRQSTELPGTEFIARLRKALQQSLDELRTGNAGKPTFSPTTLDWMQDAWTIASLDYGYQKVRSGVLFQRLVQQPTKYSMSGLGTYLEAIGKDDLKANLAKIISGSKEDAEASAASAGPQKKARGSLRGLGVRKMRPGWLNYL